MKWFDVNLAIATFVNNYFDDTACLHICMYVQANTTKSKLDATFGTTVNSYLCEHEKR